MRPVRNAHKHGKGPQLLLHKSETNEVNEILSWSWQACSIFFSSVSLPHSQFSAGARQALVPCRAPGCGIPDPVSANTPVYYYHCRLPSGKTAS